MSAWGVSNSALWGRLGIASYEGDYHLELNDHGQSDNGEAWSISQQFNTIVGQSYDFFCQWSKVIQ